MTEKQSKVNIHSYSFSESFGYFSLFEVGLSIQITRVNIAEPMGIT